MSGQTLYVMNHDIPDYNNIEYREKQIAIECVARGLFGGVGKLGM